MELKTSSRILERSARPKGKTNEVNLSLMSFLYAAIIKYCQNKSSGIDELESRLSQLGIETGLRLQQLLLAKEKSLRRETRLLPTFYYIQNTFYRFVFGKTADSLEKSNDSENEYMIIDLDPVMNKYISLPKELLGLSLDSFTAGIIQGVLAAMDYPAKVTAHLQPDAQHPGRTVFLIRFLADVIEREERFNGTLVIIFEMETVSLCNKMDLMMNQDIGSIIS